MVVYDYTVIGGGLAGLYAALRLVEKNPQFRVLLVEKENSFGGRAKTARFSNKEVVTGAGIGVYNKDHLLRKLLERYDLMSTPYTSKIDHLNESHIDTVALIEDMKTRPLDRKKTFRDNFIRLYGRELYEKFKLSDGYSDYEKADVIDTIYDYGFEDNVSGNTLFRVPWSLLIKSLLKDLKKRHVVLKRNTPVSRVYKTKTGYAIRTPERTYNSKNVIYATNLPGLSSYQDSTFQRLLLQIRCQPFLRLYIKTDRPINTITTFTITNNFLQKAIPFGDNVYMISYSDNNYANRLQRLDDDTLIRRLEKLYSIRVLNLRRFYWSCGTHYYRPLRGFHSRDEYINRVQNYTTGLYVVGELISVRQGWVEGALESVEKIFGLL